MPPPRTAVLTGASRGIGASLLARLCQRGYHVIAGGLRAPAALPPHARFFRVDVRARAEVDAFAAHVRGVFGPGGAALFVANAGVCAAGWGTEGAFLDLFEVNCAGAVRVLEGIGGARCFVAVSSGDGELCYFGRGVRERLEGVGVAGEGLREVVERLRGVVVEVAGVGEGRRAEAVWGNEPMYALSKACLNVVVREVARRGGDGGGMRGEGEVAVAVAVCPGDVRTAMGRADAEKSADEAAAEIVELAERAAKGEIASGCFYRYGDVIRW